MPAKDVLERIKEQLKSVVSATESRTLNRARKPEELSGLIQKYKKLILELNTRGFAEIGGIVSQLVKVRRELSNTFKEERQQAINEHWRKIQQENSKFIAKVERQIDEADKESDAFFARFDRETREMQASEKQMEELQNELKQVNEDLERINQTSLEHDKVIEQEENLESEFRQEFSDTPVPRPSFRNSLRQTMEDKDDQGQTQEQFGLALRKRMEDSFNQCRRFIQENSQFSQEERSAKLEQLQNIEKRYMEQLSGKSLGSLYGLYQESLVQSRRLTDIHNQIGVIKKNIGAMLGQGDNVLPERISKLRSDKVSQKLREDLEEPQDRQPDQVRSPFELKPRLKR